MTAPTLHSARSPLPTFRRELIQEAATRLNTAFIEAEQAPEGTRSSLGMPTERGTWARISWHRPGDIFPREFSGLEASVAVFGVPKPDFIQAVHWRKEGFICRVEEMTFIAQAPISTSYVVDQNPDLSESWWADLASSLKNLTATDTDRVSLVQESIDHSITQAFGAGVDTTVSHWTVGHGDLHWGNVTATQLFLLDWDSWGRMPRGLDAARLWEASYRVPTLFREVADRFAHDLSTRDGIISRAWVCANRVLGARKRRENTDQADHALKAGTRLLRELGR